MENEIVEAKIEPVNEPNVEKIEPVAKQPNDKTAIQVSVSTAERLSKLKGFKDSYNDVLVKLLNERDKTQMV